MPEKPQSFESHARIVPLYHGVVFFIFAANFFWSIYRMYRTPSVDSAIALLMAIALILLFFFARVFPLTAQDRVIRLEMRLRLRELLPADLQSRIPEFTHGQLIAMRFASDEELPALAAAVLRDKVTDKKTIKKMITHWQADHLRV